MPHVISLSEPALALLRLHVKRMGNIDVTDSNQEAYRGGTEGDILSARRGLGALRNCLPGLTSWRLQTEFQTKLFGGGLGPGV